MRRPTTVVVFVTRHVFCCRTLHSYNVTGTSPAPLYNATAVFCLSALPSEVCDRFHLMEASYYVFVNTKCIQTLSAHAAKYNHRVLSPKDIYSAETKQGVNPLPTMTNS